MKSIYKIFILCIPILLISCGGDSSYKGNVGASPHANADTGPQLPDNETLISDRGDLPIIGDWGITLNECTVLWSFKENKKFIIRNGDFLATGKYNVSAVNDMDLFGIYLQVETRSDVSIGCQDSEIQPDFLSVGNVHTFYVGFNPGSDNMFIYPDPLSESTGSFPPYYVVSTDTPDPETPETNDNEQSSLNINGIWGQVFTDSGCEILFGFNGERFAHFELDKESSGTNKIGEQTAEGLYPLELSYMEDNGLSDCNGFSYNAVGSTLTWLIEINNDQLLFYESDNPSEPVLYLDFIQEVE